MAATGYTPIILFNSTTAGNQPTTSNLAVGELALNVPDGKLYFNKSGTITLLASSSGIGVTLSNDTSTATNLYPIFANATSGIATTIYTGNAKLLYKPSTGELQASELVASNGLLVNSGTVSSSYTIATGNNAISVGPITVASGQSVTISSGQKWVVI